MVKPHGQQKNNMVRGNTKKGQNFSYSEPPTPQASEAITKQFRELLLTLQKMFLNALFENKIDHENC